MEAQKEYLISKVKQIKLADKNQDADLPFSKYVFAGPYC